MAGARLPSPPASSSSSSDSDSSTAPDCYCAESPLVRDASEVPEAGRPFTAARGWERVTVDEEKRMWLNGESAEQMAHARAIKAAGGVSLNPEDGNDTSRDQAWPLNPTGRVKCADKYVLITTVLWMAPKIMVLALPMLILHVPPMLVVRCTIASVPDGTERIRRTRGFYAVFTLTFALSLPAMLLAFVSLILDYIVYYIFSILYMVCLWRWKQTCASFEKIRPYRNGPSILLHLPDFFVCAMGQCSRQALGETLYMIACMWLLMPWLKYYMNCNPFVYDLDSRLCQQISTTMEDLGTEDQWCATARSIISRARQTRAQADRVDIWSFVPHYPYPPLDRRWALGLQAGGGEYPGKFTLIVHTTHAIIEAGGSTEQFVISNSTVCPCYRVMLWYSNPYHFLTGWVEASQSTGRPSQPEKFRGGEHPMWLVTARDSEMVSHRDSFTGSGMIDAFFDYWLPAFVHEMRYDHHRYTLGKSREEAEREAHAKYQEVCSKDGVSKPDDRIGLDKYGDNCTAADYKKIARLQGKDRMHKATDFIMSAADAPRVEQASAVVFGGADLCATSSGNQP
mmetsp:Transcript_30910/g.81169  ORF Transcript_30910/g.81169 Transcript_30910/m.81169 type:complete len:568 (-) Transcript_30910:336-2039(-)